MYLDKSNLYVGNSIFYTIYFCSKQTLPVTTTITTVLHNTKCFCGVYQASFKYQDKSLSEQWVGTAMLFSLNSTFHGLLTIY